MGCCTTSAPTKLARRAMPFAGWKDLRGGERAVHRRVLGGLRGGHRILGDVDALARGAVRAGGGLELPAGGNIVVRPAVRHRLLDRAAAAVRQVADDRA